MKSCPGNLNVAGLQLSWCDYFANLILQKYYLVIFSLNIMKRRVTARADGQNAVAARLFVLELHYERDSQIDLAETVSAAHKARKPPRSTSSARYSYFESMSDNTKHRQLLRKSV